MTDIKRDQNAKPATLRSKSAQKRKLIFKNYISSPYNLQWSVLSPEDNQFILQEIISHSPSQLLRKTSTRDLKSKADQQEISTKPDQFTKEDIVVGINAVIRTLEQKKLRMALICNSISSNLLRRQILLLCATNTIHAACISDLSKEIAPHFGINSAIAIGIKKSCSLTGCINNIIERVPQINYPWISTLAKVSTSTQSSICKTVDVSQSFETKNTHCTENNEANLSNKNPNIDNAAVSVTKDPILKTETEHNLSLSKFYKPLHVKRLQSTPKGKKKKK
ncbi:uncharacterized protein TRIADDRAFT_60249 [Trichoplax adhaerens]|uniref:Ribosomal protein L7Ae/L30e/S12e/Gadd45 domain-containing protein n=1 Tax=Trichoplax adhaerens TaxID=10228 RepID=B3S7Q0_TRIAD|nr:hypothetical protein TRIADDRAFT_60249 [Trichoplax adhaerens]EDV21332.1 hypothetical protein TRIADDRAFT_60249 [Trichoplax adhaerens]|eukprot:XP_002116299.1 hypothetical protein TRIADDRAFT_60249 [Trichoplax adhaerens]